MNDCDDLTQVSWGVFKIGDLFEFRRGKSKGLNHYLNEGDVPYLGATNRNNGVLTFLQKDKSVQKGNCIAFITNGEGSVGYSVYKSEDFIATSDLVLGYNPNLNRYVGTFITTMSDLARGRYNHDYKRIPTRLSSESIQLPITSSGEPDWSFMERYMRNKEKVLVESYLKVVKSSITQYGSPLHLTDRNWKIFSLNEVFNISASNSGIDEDKLSVSPNQIYPYISRKGTDNGYKSFISAQPLSNNDPGSCITVGLDTMTVFYQPYDFYTGQNIQILTNNNCSRYCYLFLVPIIRIQINKLSWGIGATLGRLETIKINIPVDYNDNIDWQFMDQYMRQRESMLLSDYTMQD